MNKKSNVNKPAFPARVQAMGYSDGLSKRELIAAMALQCLLAQMGTKPAAAAAVNAADELLKALESSES